MTDLHPEGQDERVWTLSEGDWAAPMWDVVQGPEIGRRESVVVVPKARLVESEARQVELERERDDEQRIREDHYMRIQEERRRAERAEAREAALVEALKGYAQRVENDRRESDKLLCHAQSMRSRALAGVVEDE